VRSFKFALPALLVCRAALAITLQPGDVLVTDEVTKSLMRVDPATGAVTTLATFPGVTLPLGYSFYAAVVVEPAGTVLVLDSLAETLYRVDPATGSVTTLNVFTGNQSIQSMALDGKGNLLLADNLNSGILSYNLATGASSYIGPVGQGPSNLFIAMQSLALDSAGKIYVTDGSGKVIVVDPSSGSQSVLFDLHALGPPFSSALPLGIAVASNGDVYVTDNYNFGIARWSGGVLAIVANMQWNGGVLTDPINIVLGANGDLYVADDGSGVYRIDSAGAVSLLSSTPLPFGIAIAAPAPTISTLVSLVSALNVVAGISNALDSKLANAQAALASHNTGNTQTAINQLNAFINAVQAQSGKKLSSAQATALIEAAQQLIASL
jgi:streptogramin lyase